MEVARFRADQGPLKTLCVASIPDDKMDNSTLKLHLLWKQLMKNKNKNPR